MSVTKLLHTRMRVNDIEKTVKFYEQALGLKATRRHTSPLKEFAPLPGRSLGAGVRLDF